MCLPCMARISPRGKWSAKAIAIAPSFGGGSLAQSVLFAKDTLLHSGNKTRIISTEITLQQITTIAAQRAQGLASRLTRNSSCCCILTHSLCTQPSAISWDIESKNCGLKVLLDVDDVGAAQDLIKTAMRTFWWMRLRPIAKANQWPDPFDVPGQKIEERFKHWKYLCIGLYNIFSPGLEILWICPSRMCSMTVWVDCSGGGGPSMSFPVLCHWHHWPQPRLWTWKLVITLWRSQFSEDHVHIKSDSVGCWQFCSAALFWFSSTALTPAIIIIEGQRVPLWGVTWGDLEVVPLQKAHLEISQNWTPKSHRKVAGHSRNLAQADSFYGANITMICNDFEILNSQRPAKVW